MKKSPNDWNSSAGNTKKKKKSLRVKQIFPFV